MNARLHEKSEPQQEPTSTRKNTSRHSRKQFRKNKYKQKLLEQEYLDWPEDPIDRTPSLNKSLKKNSIRNLERDLGRSLTEAKKKESKVNELYSDHNIFKLPSTSLISTKINKQDIRLPALDKKKALEDDLEFNPEKRRVVKITLDKLKPVPVDQVKRRFMMKYQIETVKV